MPKLEKTGRTRLCYLFSGF